jgi:isocitrate dehydrogenase kinase/phosphatase
MRTHGYGTLPVEAAQRIREGFERYLRAFLAVTRRARARFERRDWAGLQDDARERQEVYERVVWSVVAELGRLLGNRDRDAALWTAIRGSHSEMLLGHPAAEVAETFFNSVTRRVFRTVGTNPAIEYLDFRFERLSPTGRDRPYRTYRLEGDLTTAVRALLAEYAFAVPYADAERDARLAARAIDEGWEAGTAPLPLEALEVLEPVFFRRKGAYLVGRARGGDRVMPLVFALVHRDAGVAVDAVLLTEAEASIVFSFTRSYFHADVEHPAQVIEFLSSLIPAKRVSELYTALGYNKHGKTEFYRELRRHVARTDERFERAAGARGMVMEVFTLPSFDVVFKVIRDSFPPPKQTTPDAVKRRYEQVFAHDRAGRLVDAQEFEGLTLPRGRFSRELLAELLESASRSVRVDGDEVVIAHLYTERRVRPLDLYLAETDATSAEGVVLDYGQAIRDLAATGIFPGDLLLKNFGVTRHGRVVFYDYDELRLLTEDEVAAEPWYYVGPDDVFPEELGRFVPFDGGLREAFLGAHDALFTARFWNELIARQRAGEIVDVYPYGEDRRLTGGQ